MTQQDNETAAVEGANDIRKRLGAEGRQTMRAAFTNTQVQTRDDDDALVVEGYAAVFDSDSRPIMGAFVERIHRGAFRKVLADNPDVKLLLNHEGLPMARTSSGTLELREDGKGLWMRAQLPDIQAARDLVTLMQRGDVTEMSFAFDIGEDGDTWTDGADAGLDLPLREIREFSRLDDVSIVTHPAYPATTVAAVRSAQPDEQREATGSDDQGGGGSSESSPDAKRLLLETETIQLERRYPNECRT